MARFNNIGDLLNHSIIDSPALAIAYDQYLRNKLSNFARERTPSIDYYVFCRGDSSISIDIYIEFATIEREIEKGVKVKDSTVENRQCKGPEHS